MGFCIESVFLLCLSCLFNLEIALPMSQSVQINAPRFASQIVFVTGKEWKHLRKQHLSKSAFLTDANSGDVLVQQATVAARKIKHGVAGGVVYNTGTPKSPRQAALFHLDPVHYPFGYSLSNNLTATFDRFKPFISGILVQGIQGPSEPEALTHHGHAANTVENTVRQFIEHFTVFRPKEGAVSNAPSAQSAKHINHRPIKLAYIGDKDTWLVHIATRDGGDALSREKVEALFHIDKAPQDTLVFLEDRQRQKVFPLLWPKPQGMPKRHKKPQT